MAACRQTIAEVTFCTMAEGSALWRSGAVQKKGTLWQQSCMCCIQQYCKTYHASRVTALHALAAQHVHCARPTNTHCAVTHRFIGDSSYTRPTLEVVHMFFRLGPMQCNACRSIHCVATSSTVRGFWVFKPGPPYQQLLPCRTYSSSYRGLASIWTQTHWKLSVSLVKAAWLRLSRQ